MNAATPNTPHQQRMRRMGNVNPHFKNFVENTSLHGIKYICDGHSHWIKRGFWCIVVISFIILLITINKIKMDKSKENPMKIEVAKTRQHISTLPIPAFTICGPLRTSVREVEFIKKHGYMDVIYKIADILGMSRKAFNKKFHIRSTGNGKYRNGKKFVISDLSLEAISRSISMNDFLLLSTTFKYGFDEPPTFMFRGRCLSRNILPPSTIYKMNTVRKFLRNDLELKTKIVNAINITFQLDTNTINGFPSFKGYLSSGRHPGNWYDPGPVKFPALLKEPGVTYVIKIGKNANMKFIGKDNRLRFAIHNPWEVPSPFMRWHRLHPSKDSRILIEPELILEYPMNDNDYLYKVPSAKQCYNATEKTLHFFQYYTQRNCLMECSTKRALRECGCVLFFMPHNESTYICSDENSSCAVDVAKETHYGTGDRKFEDSCDCLPSCNHTDYKVISYESYRGIKPGNVIKDQKIEIVLRNDFFYSKVRTYTYDNNDMMDSIFFHLDAFLGVSIMTIAELFFYMLLYVIDYLKSKIQPMLHGLFML